MKKRIINFLKSEAGAYIFFGAMTTLVNYIVFALFSFILGYDMALISNTAAFLASVVFAYITNKLLVFRAESRQPRVLIREILSFLAARIFSYFVEQLGLYLSTAVLHLDSRKIFLIDGILIAKLILTVLVVILNWSFSKFFIFKK